MAAGFPPFAVVPLRSIVKNIAFFKAAEKDGIGEGNRDSPIETSEEFHHPAP